MENQSGKARRTARSAGYTGTSSRHESAVSRANRCSIDKMAVEPLRGSSANACKRSTSRNVSTVESSARAKPCCNKLLTTVEISSAASVNAMSSEAVAKELSGLESALGMNPLA